MVGGKEVKGGEEGKGKREGRKGRERRGRREGEREGNLGVEATALNYIVPTSV